MSISLQSCFATLPKTERGRSLVLGGDPKGKNFLYTNGINIIMRDIENPAIVDIYAEHAREVNVAKYSPSGFYIASGDITGKVRIWDTVNKEHILKNEFQPLGGRIKDIDWSPDSSKIVVCGFGGDKFASCITYDSGNTVGSLNGPTKEVNACTFKPNRPFRIALGCEDYSVTFFEGPPFKNKGTRTCHTNFVNAVRFSPSGEVFISGGSDGKAYIFDGKDGQQVGELGEPKAHNGGIYALSFNKDGSQVLTASGDKTVKLWDVSTRQLVTEFPMGKDVSDMQLGCLWQGEHMLTVSLSGFINYLDKNNPTTPIRIVKGHNKPITCTVPSTDKNRIYTGTSEGVISYWNRITGECEVVKNKGHSNQVQGMAVEEDLLTSISYDDTIRETSTISNEYGAGSSKLDSQPKSVSKKKGITVVACYNHVMVLQGDRKLTSTAVKYEPICIDLHPGLTQVAVGGIDTLVIYDLSNGVLSEKKTFKLENCNVGAVRYSPDGAFLAVVGSDKNLRGYDVASDYTPTCVSIVPTAPQAMLDCQCIFAASASVEVKSLEFESNNILGYYTNNGEAFMCQAHNARVSDVAWSPDSCHIATCSIDSGIAVWKPIQSIQNRVAAFKDSHVKSYPNKIDWLDNNTLVTVGQDSNVKQWAVKY